MTGLPSLAVDAEVAVCIVTTGFEEEDGEGVFGGSKAGGELGAGWAAYIFSHKRVVVRGFMFYLRGGYIDVYLDSYCRYVGTFLDSRDDDNGGNETTNIIIRIRRTHFQQL